MQDVRRVGEEVGPHVGGGRAGQLLEVLGQLVFGVAPGEICVGLVEADLGERGHHRGAGERLGQKQHVRVGLPDGGEQPLPEPGRLGVGVVDPEDAHAVAHPEPHDPLDFRVDSLGVVVEVDRVDVLVLLRRVLRVGDRPVGPRGEPLRVLLDPGMVGRGLQRQVDRHFHAEFPGAGDERVEVGERAEVRVDGVVPAFRRADRPRRARVAGARLKGVVPPLAEGRADGVDRRQVDDVEAHLRDRLKTARRGVQRPGDRLPAAHRVELHTFRAREELVPGPVEGALPLDEDWHPPGPGHVVPERVLREDRRDPRCPRRLEPVPGRQAPVTEPAAECGEVAARRRGAGRARRLLDRPRRALEEQRAFGQHQFDVLAARDLDARVVIPVRDRIRPGLNVVLPGAFARHGHVRSVAVRARLELPHPDQRAGFACRISEHHAGTERAVPLYEDGRADLEGLAGDRLSWAAPALHHGLDIEDGDASDHAVKVPSPARSPSRRPQICRPVRRSQGLRRAMIRLLGCTLVTHG